MNNLVSIVIPVYNRAHLIRETISSALAQDYDHIEVVIVDNASTDGTWELLQTAASNDARVKVFRNATNVGPVRNWRACLERASGTYTKILWSDDLIHPQFLSQSVPLLADGTVGFVYSAVKIFSNNYPESGVLRYRHLHAGNNPSRDFVRGILLSQDLPFSPGCALLRTKDALEYMKVDVPNSIGSDFASHAIGNDLLLLLLTAQAYDQVAFIDQTLSYFRAHTTSISTTASAGKLQLHYGIVKAYFAQTHLRDAELQRKLNAHLLLDKWRFAGADYKIAALQDFYPGKEHQAIDLFLFAALAMREAATVAVRPLRTRLRSVQ